MATRREMATEQLRLMDEIRAKSNINLVECGNCGTLLLHKMDVNVETVECFGCKEEMAKSDCGDFWYEGCINNSEFDED